MENDRFMVTKKINVGALPDPSHYQAQVGDPSTIKTTLERSAQEVHEAYLARIQELKAKRKQDEENKRLAE